ncbi:MAG: Transposase [Candidatus Nomurabacteria bacterium GW2011_GWF2_43_8]|uniref:Transposase n=3 Tax=Candidatus Nomuraibacteriota TaxID=1752729 RepID=A0A0G1FQU0_9BACT|nr:MAG: Transposase [Candidatus Nomurabacteria bacterium GW2011_GWA2_43_15]KKT19838.1 MAG: Transposase [Candidatus Nomurabacteria bacterium GW2011_GWB1_43_7]KKT24720.1 MAG: Transposase [Candidatus Nomurabacteria bacterium GW2011_GWF2_43_8]
MFRKDLFITGEYYHIYNRGIDKRIIFKLQRDYERFIMLLYLANSQESFRLDDIQNKSEKTFEKILILEKGTPIVSVGAWGLMTNHFHLLIKQEIEGGITKFMRKLGTGYSMFFNIKYQRKGALFGGPFKSRYIARDLHLKHLFGYIHLNPLDIKFSSWEKSINKKHPNEWKDFLENYRYSSYQDYSGIKRAEGNILNKTAFPEYFNDKNSFQDFIDDYLSFPQGQSLREGSLREDKV